MFLASILAVALLAVAVLLSFRANIRFLLFLAVICCVLAAPNMAAATVIATPNGDGTETVTDLTTGFSFVRVAPFLTPAPYGPYGGYYVSPSISVSRFNGLSTYRTVDPFFVTSPVLTRFRPAVVVDRRGRLFIR